jgi:hypothetical protein
MTQVAGQATDGLAAAEIERIATRLMFGDSPGHIAVARDRFSQRLGDRDYVCVEISIPHASEGLGEQFEEVFQRTLIAPCGTIERAVVMIAAVCDELDPGGRDAEAWEPDESPAPTVPAQPEPAEVEEDSPLLPAEGAPGAEASAAEPSENADDAGQNRGGEAPEPPTAPAADGESQQRQTLPSLRELMQDLPLDRDRLTEGLVDMPKSEAVVQAFLVQLRRMIQRFENVRRFVDEVAVCDEVYLDGGVVEKEAAKLALGELGEMLDDLREDLFCYLSHVGAGRLVELDDEAMEAVRKVARSAPRYKRRMNFLVQAAVKYLAELPNCGGVPAAAEQRRGGALDEKYHRNPRRD